MPCARRSGPRSASASRRSSTRATRGRCCATGPSARTSSWASSSASGVGAFVRDGPAATLTPMSASDEIDVEPEQVAEWLAGDGELQVVDVREEYERDAG